MRMWMSSRIRWVLAVTAIAIAALGAWRLASNWQRPRYAGLTAAEYFPRTGQTADAERGAQALASARSLDVLPVVIDALNASDSPVFEKLETWWRVRPGFVRGIVPYPNNPAWLRPYELGVIASISRLPDADHAITNAYRGLRAPVRCDFLGYLGELGGDPGVYTDLLRSEFLHGDESTRAAAARALLFWTVIDWAPLNSMRTGRKSDPRLAQVLPELIRFFEERPERIIGNPPVPFPRTFHTTDYIRYLGYLGTNSVTALPLLKRLAANPSQEIRDEAQMALRNIPE